MDQMVDCLLSKCKAMSINPRTIKKKSKNVKCKFFCKNEKLTYHHASFKGTPC
jgi:hypothetical protein